MSRHSTSGVVRKRQDAGADGPGHLYAIDATGTGNVTETGGVWHVGGKKTGRSVSNVVIADGLLYAAELAGFISCIDADSGRVYWRHDIRAGVWGSPIVADGKVFVGTTDGEVLILKHGKTARQFASMDMRHPIYSTPTVASGVLYITSTRNLYAIEKPK